jgi:hypothetical protein
MKIEEELIEGYLDSILFAASGEQGGPIDQLSDLDYWIDGMKARAERAGHLETLRTFLDWSLSDPTFDYRRFQNGGPSYGPQKVREMLIYARRRIWPGVPPSREPVELVSE